MVYEIRFTDLALQRLAKLAKSEPKAYQKALRFIEELKEHPYMGTGHPEPLKASLKTDGADRFCHSEHREESR